MSGDVAKALARVSSGLYVVTAQHNNARSAMVASWVSQVGRVGLRLSLLAVFTNRPIIMELLAGLVSWLSVPGERSGKVGGMRGCRKWTCRGKGGAGKRVLWPTYPYDNARGSSHVTRYHNSVLVSSAAPPPRAEASGQGCVGCRWPPYREAKYPVWYVEGKDQRGT